MDTEVKIAIIGLGYVGLPLAVEFAKKYQVVGFDINEGRIKELKEGIDRTMEVSKENLKKAFNLTFSSSTLEISSCNFYVITVPTPIDNHKNPDLTPLLKASETVGRVLKKGDIVVYESTVYPSCTEEECIPILERISGLKFNSHFFCGYSPERINPGDKLHTVSKIKKVTSGSTPDIAYKINSIYASIITAGTFMASSIKVAEASKVIENSQRDLNIAFVNELAKIFSKIGIDTTEVLDAASTKWNFLPFKPGLVGGHCIGVDPFYLTHKAESLGYHPEIILAGRRLNDGMGEYIASQVIKLMIKNGQAISGAKTLVLGITFKENCPDVRNSKVIDLIEELGNFGADVLVYDPWANKNEVLHEYKIELIDNIYTNVYDSIILAVGHEEFLEIDFNKIKSHNAVVFDVKSFLPKNVVDARL
jgi:UDP-N-acetyl-D-glucosamine/UDP-N-acetyl-D-galactosamine dehydrogenase